MSYNVKDYLKESREIEIATQLSNILNDLETEGLSVEFGKIGVRTTYALIHNEDHSIEIVGYTFLKNMDYYKENVGKLKALQQALARRDISSKEKD